MLETLLGSWDVAMAVYEDASFTSVAGADFTIEVPNHIFIGMALVDAGNFVLQALECWVTPDASPDHEVHYDVLNDGCANVEVIVLICADILHHKTSSQN